MDAPQSPHSPGLFRPDAFFLRPWRGWGVVRNARGRTIDRFVAHGRGRTASRRAAAEQVFTFESGLVHTVEWDILTDDEDHYYARDLRSGQEARGRSVDGEFTWTFRSPAPDRLGRLFPVTTTARYTLATPTAAFSFTEARRFGLLQRTFIAFYQQDA